LINQDFWQGKKVFLTGHTGFKGSWLSIWLSSLGADVKGYALKPQSSPSLFEEAKVDSIIDSYYGDIRDFNSVHEVMKEFNPDILIHMAAQPLVRYSYAEPIETYEVNVIGSVNVLEAARSCKNLKAIVNITTDKCYENEELDLKYSEDAPLGGHDPYSSSKACAELVSSAYKRSFLQHNQVGLATVRAGNVIGGGDWAQDRLLPDILRSFEQKIPALIRYPKSIRPWQHVLEPLSGYLILAQKLYYDYEKFSEGWNFGPREEDAKSVEWILDKMTSKWPYSSWKLDEKINPHEAGFLKLDISKAYSRLGWQPTWNIDFALEKIIEWHQAWLNNQDMHLFCLAEIREYSKDMKNENC
jgi:CDP-glucose 4,6-dehydratase